MWNLCRIYTAHSNTIYCIGVRGRGGGAKLLCCCPPAHFRSSTNYLNCPSSWKFLPLKISIGTDRVLGTRDGYLEISASWHLRQPSGSPALWRSSVCHLDTLTIRSLARDGFWEQHLNFEGDQLSRFFYDYSKQGFLRAEKRNKWWPKIQRKKENTKLIFTEGEWSQFISRSAGCRWPQIISPIRAGWEHDNMMMILVIMMTMLLLMTMMTITWWCWWWWTGDGDERYLPFHKKRINNVCLP